MGIVDKLKKKFTQVNINSNNSGSDQNRAAQNIPQQEEKNTTQKKQDDSNTSSSDIDEKTIYRNRYNHGANLGSLFVLENWIYGTVSDCGGDCEYDSVKAIVDKKSKDEAIEKLAAHYKEYISKIDWDFLQNDAKITALRVPVGFWHVDNGSFVDDLPFSDMKDIYQQTKPWDYLKEIVKTAGDHKIGVLIDLHALPGGANADAHSGMINKDPSFFSNGKYVDKVVDEILPFIVKDVCSKYNNVIGLQVANEIKFDDKAENEKNYYKKAVKAVTSIDKDLPVIISDGWWPGQWSDWASENKLDNNIIIDSHVYRCFSDDDKNKNSDQIIDALKDTVNFDKDKADFMVGEFSCNYDDNTWKKTEGDRSEASKKFGTAQVDRFKDVSSWGWFFWTLQFQYGDGGEWGFIKMTKDGNIPKRSTGSIDIDQNKVKQLTEDHDNYWKSKGGCQIEKYKDGLNAAISDIQAFNNFNSSRVGRWHAWATKRHNDYVAKNGDNDHMWEWDEGYKAGIQNFKSN